MAKANIKTSNGVIINIEGTPDEVVSLVSRLQEKEYSPRKSSAIIQKKKKSGPATPTTLVSGLLDAGFFKKQRILADIRVELEKMGYRYPATTLSPIVLRLVRRGQLNRVKNDKQWAYVR